MTPCELQSHIVVLVLMKVHPVWPSTYVVQQVKGSTCCLGVIFHILSSKQLTLTGCFLFSCTILYIAERWLSVTVSVHQQFLKRENSLFSTNSHDTLTTSRSLNALSCCHVIDWFAICVNKQLNNEETRECISTILTLSIFVECDFSLAMCYLISQQIYFLTTEFQLIQSMWLFNQTP